MKRKYHVIFGHKAIDLFVTVSVTAESMKKAGWLAWADLPREDTKQLDEPFCESETESDFWQISEIYPDAVGDERL